MRRPFEALATGVALGLTLAACSSGGDVPQPTRPDNTLEQVEHNLGGDELSKLTLTQTVSLSTPDGERVNLYNLTSERIDPKRFKLLIEYLVSVGQDPPSNTITLYSNGKSAPQIARTFSMPRHEAEHDFVLVPPGTNMPPGMGNENPQARTKFFDGVSQAITVVKQPEDEVTKQPAPFESASGVEVEACQSMIHVLTTGAEGLSQSVQGTYERLGQETICNNRGDAMQIAASGASYEQYLAAVGKIGDYVVQTANGSYSLDAEPVSPEEYAAMQKALVP